MSGVVAVVQARSGSSRLPNKVLADMGGMPMLAFQLHRLRPLGVPVVVATSDLPGDDDVAAVASAAGAEVVRGSEADVLSRFVLALDTHPAEVVVRLTGDCPLTDPAIVAAVVDTHRSTGADYTSNVLPRSYPKGLDVEVIAPAALREADRLATAGPDREHVTPYLYRHPERYRLANHRSGRDLGEEWWTVDTAIDRVRGLVDRLGEPIAATWLDVLAVAGRQVVPTPGEVWLAPGHNPVPGSTPWRREWDASVDGVAVGTVAVDVEQAEGRREIAVDETYRAAAVAALDRLLAGDQQLR